jgi:hypothetical protein
MSRSPIAPGSWMPENAKRAGEYQARRGERAVPGNVPTIEQLTMK